MRTKRLKPEVRKEDLLAVALPLAVEMGYTKVSREIIAEAAGVSGPALNYHFGTMTKFRRELIRYAIRKECLTVIVQALSAGVSCAKKAPIDLRRKALNSLL